MSGLTRSLLPIYHRFCWECGLRLRALHIFRSIGRSSHIERIVEIGSVSEVYLRAFRKRYPRSFIVGIELDALKAKRCMDCRIDGVQYLVADATRLPLADSSVDAVVCSDVLEHIEDDKAAMEEISRVLSPQGHLHLHVPAIGQQRLFKSTRSWSDPDHKREGYDVRQLLLALASAGFAIEQQESTCKFFGRLAWETQEKLRQTVPFLIPLLSPLLTLMALIDSLSRSSDGNGIFIRARKPVGGEAS